MMKKSKIWIVKGIEGTFSDEELITLIKKGKLLGKHKIICKDMKDWLMIKDSIYQFYLKENVRNDENI